MLLFFDQYNKMASNIGTAIIMQSFSAFGHIAANPASGGGFYLKLLDCDPRTQRDAVDARQEMARAAASENIAAASSDNDTLRRLALEILGLSIGGRWRRASFDGSAERSDRPSPSTCNLGAGSLGGRAAIQCQHCSRRLIPSKGMPVPSIDELGQSDPKVGLF